MAIEDCANCEQLEKSCSTRPAVPMGGTCNDTFHACPRCGRRWWQFNDYFHLWQEVADDKQWERFMSGDW